MTASVPVPARVVPGPGRAAAGLAVSSAVVHLLLLDGATLGSLVMAVMTVACLPCGWRLWTGPSAATWGLTAALDGGMLVLHAKLMSAPAHGHHAGRSPGWLMWLGAGLLALQLAVAGLAACRPRRPGWATVQETA